jgi:hypothetical protein
LEKKKTNYKTRATSLNKNGSIMSTGLSPTKRSPTKTPAPSAPEKTCKKEVPNVTIFDLKDIHFSTLIG